MRKVTLILVGLLFAGSVALAQKGKVTSALTYLDNGEIEKAWQAIQAAEQNPKTANYFKTYYAKGRILQRIGESKDPKIRNMVDEPLKKAWENYQKAIQLDEKKKIHKSIEIYLPMLNADFINAAVEEFKKKEFKSAMEYFDYALKVGEDPVFNGIVDTSIIYNAGLSAYNGKIWNKAIEYLTQAKDLDYGGGAAYVLLKNAYLEKGDTLTGLKVLQEGFEKYPTEKTIIFELINYYLLVEDNSQAAIDYINKAMQQDPENASLYFAKGLALDKLGKHEEAIEAYKQSIEKDPTYLNAYYNLGALIFNDGVTMFNKCNEIMDNEKFKECVKQADEKFKESLPYLEKAHELDPKEINTLETLKVLYYRLHMYDKRDKIVKELDEVKNTSGGESK